LATVSAAAFGFASLHRLRNLVYRQGQERGAVLVNEDEAALGWIPPAADRASRFQQLCIAYSALALASLIITGVFAGSLFVVLSLAAGLAGPGIALFLIHSGQPGHIGVLRDQLMVVDHTNTYHLGSGPNIHYRRHFVLIDDVVVFTGSRWLPVFDQQQLQARVAPLAHAGIKVDRKTVAVKLLEEGHVLARAAATCLASTGLAGLLLLLGSL
jgi:hypothetical protein